MESALNQLIVDAMTALRCYETGNHDNIELIFRDMRDNMQDVESKIEEGDLS